MRGHKELQLGEEPQLRFFSEFLGPGTIEKVHIRDSNELELEILFNNSPIITGEGRRAGSPAQLQGLRIGLDKLHAGSPHRFKASG